MPGAFVTNITASPMRFTTFAPAAAITSPVVASNRSSITASCVRLELLPQTRCSPRGRRTRPRAARRSAPRSARRRRCSAGRSPGGDAGASSRARRRCAGTRRRRSPGTCARRRRTRCCSASGASMFERSNATSASATRPTASPIVRISCRTCSCGDERREQPEEAEHLDVLRRRSGVRTDADR